MWETFGTDPPTKPSDGLHFIVEVRDLTDLQSPWGCIERSWELPNPLFLRREDAERAARALAFHGDHVYRVISPEGEILEMFCVTKYLLCIQKEQRTVEALPSGFDPPMVHEAMQGATVAFPSIKDFEDLFAFWPFPESLLKKRRSSLNTTKGNTDDQLDEPEKPTGASANALDVRYGNRLAERCSCRPLTKR